MALRFTTKPTKKTLADQNERPEPVVLDDVSFDAFSAALASPPPPNAKLRALFVKK